MKITFGLDNPTLFSKIIALRKQIWPDFIRVPEITLLEIYQRFPTYQIAIEDTSSNLIGIANAISIAWHDSLQSLPEEGVSWVMNNGNMDKPNMLVGISVTLARNYRNQGFSQLLLNTLKQIAIKDQLDCLLIPARPTLKKYHPLVPMQKYIKWNIDPWIRTHLQMGAKFVKICERSATVVAPIAQWQTWTNKLFPADGFYVIEGALTPIEINHTKNIGTYIEPNVWVSYDLTNEVMREEYNKTGTTN